MPQNTKQNLSPPTVPALKRGRGRPRKAVAPEALAPFEKRSVVAVNKIEKQEKKLPTAEKKPKKQRMNPATSDRSYSMEEVEFMNALAEFKRASGRTFPTCSEILDILRGLGYEKVTYA